MENDSKQGLCEFAIVKAEESGVTIFPIHKENGEGAAPIRLDEGELLIMIISEHLRGYKLRGKVELLTRLGRISGESALIVKGTDVKCP